MAASQAVWNDREIRPIFYPKNSIFGGDLGGNLCKSVTIKDWLGRESNPRHEDFQSSALPTELPSRWVGQISSPGRAGKHFCEEFRGEEG